MITNSAFTFLGSAIMQTHYKSNRTIEKIDYQTIDVLVQSTSIKT